MKNYYSMRKIIVIGSSNTDMVIRSERLPKPGETVMGGTFYMSPGGKGANQAVTAARLGATVYFVAKTGDDLFGKEAIENYRDAGIDTRFIRTEAQVASGVALIMVDAKAENCISVANGANNRLLPADIDEVMSFVEEDDIVLLQLEIPIDTVLYAIDEGWRRKARVVLNPAPAAPIPVAYFPKIYLLTPNRVEAEMLSGLPVSDMEEAAKAMQKLHTLGIEVVVMTLGGEGALLSHRKGTKHFPARKVEAVDTVGAGDVFNGALCVALSEGKGIEDAILFASVASSVSVTRNGAQTSIPDREELNILIENLK